MRWQSWDMRVLSQHDWHDMMSLLTAWSIFLTSSGETTTNSQYLKSKQKLRQFHHNNLDTPQKVINHIHRAISFCISCKSEIKFRLRIDVNSFGGLAVSMNTTLPHCCLQTKLQLYIGVSSETQGQSVGSGEKAERKFSSMGERAPGYRLPPNYFQNFKRMPAPDWAQKCFVLLCPIGEQFLLSFFREFVHDGCCLATLARFVHQACACKGNFYFYFPNQKGRNYRWVAKTFGMLWAGAIEFGPNILFLTDHNVS